DRVDQFGGGGVFEQEAAGPGPQRLVHVVVEVERGEHQHPRPLRAGWCAEDLAGCLQPVHDRHPHVHQDDVGLQVPGLADRVGAVSSLAHHQQAWLRGEYRGEAFAHHRLVVDDQAARGHAAAGRAPGRHAAWPSGSTADTTKPPSGAGPADSEPPSSATRSRIPVSPWPGPCSFRAGPEGPPGPLATRSRTAPASWSTDTVTAAPGACWLALDSDSCTIRYAHTATPEGTWSSAGGTDSSTDTPARRAASTSAGRSASWGCGASPAGWSWRSTPSSRRISVSASRATPLSEPNSARADSGRSLRRYGAVSARTAISDM